MPRSFCEECCWKPDCKEHKTNCNAIGALYKICAEQDHETKTILIREYAKELGVIEYEVSAELQALGEKVISGMPELSYIRDYDIKIGYVMSYYPKRQEGKIRCGECKKINGIYTAFLPFDFVITFYYPNIYYMTDNQKKVLMLHELKHIGIGPKGLRIEPHDIEDFDSILNRYGLRWNGFGNDVTDILAGGGDEAAQEKNDPETGRKRQKMAT